MFSAPLKLKDPVVVPLPKRHGAGIKPRLVPPAPRPARLKLGQILVDMGAVKPDDLVRALAMQTREDVRLGDVLLAHGLVSQADLTLALSRQFSVRSIDPVTEPPDARLVDRFGVAHCVTLGLLPWRQAGGVTVIATSRPEAFARHRDSLVDCFGPVAMVIVSEPDLHRALRGVRQSAMAQLAETRVAAIYSARKWNLAGLRGGFAVALLGLGVTAALAPSLLIAVLSLWAVLTLAASTGLKLATLFARLPAMRRDVTSGFATRRHATAIARLPRISMMVPLFRESDIAPRLIARLGRITYPRELLDILLVVEADDAITQAALAASDLPPWMRIIAVPAGVLKTKPRALNFALDFCRGSIIGVWDAEDAPEPDQLFHVVRRFAERGPEVACLQGVLDFYNPRTNWMSRCFTIEYAAWFRVMLPGLQRLGLPLPLGGTTLFFRRAVLEALGGWDAHNVTEDADLGIRLARRGYRTELLETVTDEEANCRILPWVRQRSRWLKGYAVTYAVHMRRPRRLLAELGWWRFAGFQVLFLGTLTQFVLAPLLWSLWVMAVGLPHPLQAVLPDAALTGIGLLFLASEAVNIATALLATSGLRHRHLRFWIPALQLYFPLGAFAAWKGMAELVLRPFYWDKTSHGKFDCEGRWGKWRRQR